jgi:hypothetical protein
MEKTAIATKRPGKFTSTANNEHATIEETLEIAFF